MGEPRGQALLRAGRPGLAGPLGRLGLAAHSSEQKRLRMLASQRAATAQIPAPVVPPAPSCKAKPTSAIPPTGEAQSPGGWTTQWKPN